MSGKLVIASVFAATCSTAANGFLLKESFESSLDKLNLVQQSQDKLRKVKELAKDDSYFDNLRKEALVKAERQEKEFDDYFVAVEALRVLQQEAAQEKEFEDFFVAVEALQEEAAQAAAEIEKKIEEAEKLLAARHVVSQIYKTLARFGSEQEIKVNITETPSETGSTSSSLSKSEISTTSGGEQGVVPQRPSNDGFLRKLSRCVGGICNASFGSIRQ